MTDDLFERLLAAELKGDPRAVPPARVLDEILQTTRRSRPVPRWLALMKEPPMRLASRVAVGSPTVRLATILATTVALLLAVAAAVAAAASLVPKTPFIATPVPEELRADWAGGGRPGSEALPQTFRTDGAMAIRFDDQTFRVSDVHNGVSSSTSDPLISSVSATTPGELRLSLVEPWESCAAGAEGTYTYALSDDQVQLTLTAVDDECALRATVLAGDWWRDGCPKVEDLCLGQLSAGTHRSTRFDPNFPAGGTGWQPRHGALTYTVPDGWVNVFDGWDTFFLAPASPEAVLGGAFNNADAIYVLARMGAAAVEAVCPAPVDPAIERTATAMAQAFAERPGLQVRSGPTSMTIGDRDAVVMDLDLAPGWTEGCYNGPVVNLLSEADPPGSGPTTWSVGTGDSTDPQRIVLFDLGAGDVVAVVIDSKDPATIDDLVAKAMPIVESFRFADR